jgi:hypothetical protein
MHRSQAREQEREAESRQLRRWKQWRHERLDALLAGPYAEPANALCAFLKTMSRPTALIEFVKSGLWASADPNTRSEVLALVNTAIIRQRERRNMEPFDDALPGQPKNVFLILREYLFPSDDGAARGVARFMPTPLLKHEISHDRESFYTPAAV